MPMVVDDMFLGQLKNKYATYGFRIEGWISGAMGPLYDVYTTRLLLSFASEKCGSMDNWTKPAKYI